MASRIFSRIVTRRVVVSGSMLGAAGFVGSQALPGGDDEISKTEAQVQFETSYGYVVNNVQMIKPPETWKGPVFKIHNEYPRIIEANNASTAGQGPAIPGPDMPLPNFDPKKEAPWLNVDFNLEPEKYCELIKLYCWDGNVDNNFVVQNNPIRPWYHAPWMHWNLHGREPLHGLTFERPTPAFELASTQSRPLQTWACGYYNWAGKYSQ